MKIIIDSNLPLQGGFAAAQTIKDPALGQIRSSTAGGLSRLVLDFNYLLPDFFVQETEHELRVEISKTFAHTTERVVARGIVYGHQRRADSFGPNVVNYLKVNLKVGNEVKPVLAQNRILGSENVSALAKRFGAVAAINGAFFSMATAVPWVLLCLMGRLLVSLLPPVPHWAWAPKGRLWNGSIGAVKFYPAPGGCLSPRFPV